MVWISFATGLGRQTLWVEWSKLPLEGYGEWPSPVPPSFLSLLRNDGCRDSKKLIIIWPPTQWELPVVPNGQQLWLIQTLCSGIDRDRVNDALIIFFWFSLTREKSLSSVQKQNKTQTSSVMHMALLPSVLVKISSFHNLFSKRIQLWQDMLILFLLYKKLFLKADTDQNF